MVFHTGSSPVLTTNMSRWWNWLDTKPQQERWNAVTDSEVQGVEGEDYAWLQVRILYGSQIKINKMKDRGCNNCKHYKSEFDFWGEKPTQRICLSGKNKEVKDWWLNNGKKTIKDEIDQMDCFEPTESSVRLDKMSSLLDKMSEIIEKK